MSEVATDLTPSQTIPEPAPQSADRIASIRHIAAIGLIALGGIFTLVWTAFFGWAAGKIFNLW